MKKEIIEKFINGDIKWDVLKNQQKSDTFLVEIDNNLTIMIDKEKVKNIIEKTIKSEYLTIDLVSWANVVRFSECFGFDEKYQDCIISILDRIEESDEEGNELQISDYQIMLNKLDKNEEW